MASSKARRARRRSGPVKSTIVAVLGGVLAGAAIAAVHVLLIGAVWPSSTFALYSAFSLLWVCPLIGAGVAVWTFRRHVINHRFLTAPAVLITALAVAIPTAMLGLVPPAGAREWAAGVLDASIPLSTSLDALDPSLAPVLGERLAGNEVWIATGLQFLLVMALVVAMIRYGLRRALCRSCRTATRFHEGAFRWLASDLVAARQHIESRDWSFFRASPAPDGQGSALRFDLTTCPGCGAGNALDVAIEQDGRKNPRLVSNLTLSRDDVRTIQSLA